jgi:hypothetical protein
MFMMLFYKRPDAGYHNKTLYFVRDEKALPYVEDSKNRSGAFSFKVYIKTSLPSGRNCYLLCGESLVGDDI